MTDQSITCPHCGKTIQLTEAITHQIDERLRAQFDLQTKNQQRQFDLQLKAKEAEIDKRLAQERAVLETQARQRAEAALGVELKDLKEQLLERSRQLESSRTAELELRKQQRALEERERNLKLEVERTLDQERKLIRDQILAQAAEAQQLKDREKDHQLAQLRTQIEELKRKAEQGSQQRQGEVMELELEDQLRAAFPTDQITPVAKGKRGGDIIQRVRTRGGELAGSILWETKRTKNWSDGWITKLKDDQRAEKAEAAVVVSEALPGSANCIQQMDGVWVVDFASAIGLGIALRELLLEIAQARGALAGKNEKMEVLYNYLSGPQFRQRVEAIVESFATMKIDLDTERRAMEKQWAKREKQIERVIRNTAGMYGDLEGIIGASLPAVKILQLPVDDENPPAAKIE